MGRLGKTSIVFADISLLGAGVVHHEPVTIGAVEKLSFDWEGERIRIECRIVRSTIDRVSTGSDGLTVYHSGIAFIRSVGESATVLRKIIADHVRRALDEQKANAKGVMPESTDKMPIFRGGVLTANRAEMSESMEPETLLPTSRIIRQTTFVTCRLDKRNWKKTISHDGTQPENGFTVPATEDPREIELLCNAYERSDEDGRSLIRVMAELSLTEGEGIPPGRFDP